MGVYAGPDVSESGLVLSLDAGNTKGFDKFENLTLQTSQIGVTPTYSVAGIVGLNTTATTAPNNLYEASLLDNNGNTNQYVYGGAAVGLTTNTTYTYSIHIKQGTKPDFQITIDENGFGGKRYYSIFTYSNESVTTGVTGAANDGVLVGSTATKLTNGWYRLSLTFTTSTTAASGFVDMINRFGNTSGSNYLWGRQLEIGSTVTDYYATTGTAKNRGSTLIDLSGRGNTGTLTNGPTYSSANGGSIVFDGVDDYISSNGGLTNNSDFSVSFWIKYQDSLVSNRGLISSWDTSWNGFGIAAASSSGIRSWTNNGAGGGMNWDALSTIQNRWAHLTLTYTFSDKTQRGYINAVFKNSESFGSTISHSTLQIGRGGQTSSTQLGFYPYVNCLISNVQIYNRALTSAEIQQNYNATKSRYGL